MRPNKIFFIFIFLMVSYFLISRDYTYIDEYALRAPSTEDMESLVSYLIKPASDDFEKVRAIYFWITHNFLLKLKIRLWLKPDYFTDCASAFYALRLQP